MFFECILLDSGPLVGLHAPVYILDQKVKADIDVVPVEA